MLTSIRGLMAATVLAGSVFVAAPAFAQDSDLTISANASIVTQYRFRGVDLSGGDFAVQGGVDVGHSSGFYVGTWGSSLDEDTVGYGHTELDIYAGWSGNVMEGVAADVGVLYYLYPNADALAGDTDYYEVYGSLGFDFGPANTTLGVAYAPKQDSLGGTDNIYVYADLGVGVPSTPITVTAHVGYTDGFLTYTTDSKAWDWSIGASYAVSQNVSFGVSYVDVEGDIAPGNYNFTRDAFLGTLTASF